MTKNFVETVRENASRIATLGSWPSYMDPEGSLVSRVPGESGTAPGIDAGVCCALGLIPEDKQRLSATLHGAYTPEAVEQVRKEVESFDPDSETTWWLAACSLCKEGGIDAAAFEKQIENFKILSANPEARVSAAKATFDKMKKNFQLLDGVPFGVVDGCLQGAYVSGYDWGVQYNPAFGIFFIGTFRETLGLETFPFSDKKDEAGRPMSGPVWGSKQFVKASSFAELAEVVRVVREKLG
jgi:hypothetical protein